MLSPVLIYSLLNRAREIEPAVRGIVVENDDTVFFIVPGKTSDGFRLARKIEREFRSQVLCSFDNYVGPEEKLWS